MSGKSKGRDFVERVAAEAARDALAGWSIQKSTADGGVTIGCLNADNTKVTLANGHEYKVIISGKPARCGPCFKIDEETYYMPGAEIPILSVDGGQIYPYALVRGITGDAEQCSVHDYFKKQYAIIPVPSNIKTASDKKSVASGQRGWEMRFTPYGNHIVFVVSERVQDSDQVVNQLLIHWAMYHDWGITAPEIEGDSGTFTYSQLQTGVFDITPHLQEPDDPVLPSWDDSWTWNGKSDPSVSWTFTLENESPAWPEDSVVKKTYTDTLLPWPTYLDDPQELKDIGLSFSLALWERYSVDGKTSTPGFDVLFTGSCFKKIWQMRRLKNLTVGFSDGDSVSADYTYATSYGTPEYWLDERRVVSASIVADNNHEPENSGSPSQLPGNTLKYNFDTPDPFHPASFNFYIIGWDSSKFLDTPPANTCDMHMHFAEQNQEIRVGVDRDNNEICKYMRHTLDTFRGLPPAPGSNGPPITVPFTFKTHTYIINDPDTTADDDCTNIVQVTSNLLTYAQRFTQEVEVERQTSLIISIPDNTVQSIAGMLKTPKVDPCATPSKYTFTGTTRKWDSGAVNNLPFHSSKTDAGATAVLGHEITFDSIGIGTDGPINLYRPFTDGIGTDVNDIMNDWGDIYFDDLKYTATDIEPLISFVRFRVIDTYYGWGMEVESDSNSNIKNRFTFFTYNPTENKFSRAASSSYLVEPKLDEYRSGGIGAEDYTVCIKPR